MSRAGASHLAGGSTGGAKLVDVVAKPWAARFRDDAFGAVVVSRRLGRWLEHIIIDVEGGVGYRQGVTDAPVGWVSVYPRFDRFPLNRIVYTTAAVSTGVNYVAQLPQAELGTPEEVKPKTSKLLHYFSPEVTFAHPNYPNHEVVIRYHHRSGVFGLFGGVWGGSNVIAAGYRHRF